MVVVRIITRRIIELLSSHQIKATSCFISRRLHFIKKRIAALFVVPLASVMLGCLSDEEKVRILSVAHPNNAVLGWHELWHRLLVQCAYVSAGVII